MSRTARPRRLAFASAVAVGAVLLLGACSSTQQPGAAVIVGGQATPDSVVASQADEVRLITGAAGTSDPKVNRQVISVIVQGEVIDSAAAAEGITVTQSQVDGLIDQASKQSSLTELQVNLAQQYGVAPSQLTTFARSNLQYQGLVAKLGKGDQNAGQTAAGVLLNETAKQLGVSVNPRFGQWSVGAFSVVPGPNDLSEPLLQAKAAEAIGEVAP